MKPLENIKVDGIIKIEVCFSKALDSINQDRIGAVHHLTRGRTDRRQVDAENTITLDEQGNQANSFGILESHSPMSVQYGLDHLFDFDQNQRSASSGITVRYPRHGHTATASLVVP